MTHSSVGRLSISRVEKRVVYLVTCQMRTLDLPLAAIGVGGRPKQALAGPDQQYDLRAGD